MHAMPTNETISLGGTILKTTLASLTSKPGMLAAMFGGNMKHAYHDQNGRYFINRSERYFEAILRFLRTGAIDESLNLDMLDLELEYFGIPPNMFLRYIQKL